MHNYSTHMFTSVNLVGCPCSWLFHSTRVECPRAWLFHSTHGIAQDMSIPHYGKHGPREHITRFVLPVSCYPEFSRVENEVIIEWYCTLKDELPESRWSLANDIPSRATE